MVEIDGTPDEVRMAYLHPSRLRRRREQCSVAWLPTGTIEWHGLHLPLGFDGVKAELLCIAAARQVGGVVFPPMFYGDHRGMVIEGVLTPEMSFATPMSFDHRGSVNRFLGTRVEAMTANASREHALGAAQQHVDLCLRSFWMIRAYGFSKIVAVAGHYPNSLALRLATERFEALQRTCKVIYGTEAELAGHGAGDHAARYETSQMMALDPELVMLGALSAELDEPTGVLGEDPRLGSREQGLKIVSQFTHEVARRLAALEPDATDDADEMEVAKAPLWPGPLAGLAGPELDAALLGHVENP
ncbi:MAG: creatininase family protein [Candidatus Dormibacteria bacterium]